MLNESKITRDLISREFTPMRGLEIGLTCHVAHLYTYLTLKAVSIHRVICIIQFSPISSGGRLGIPYGAHLR